MLVACNRGIYCKKKVKTIANLKWEKPREKTKEEGTETHPRVSQY